MNWENFLTNMCTLFAVGLVGLVYKSYVWYQDYIYLCYVRNGIKNVCKLGLSIGGCTNTDHLLYEIRNYVRQAPHAAPQAPAAA